MSHDHQSLDDLRIDRSKAPKSGGQGAVLLIVLLILGVSAGGYWWLTRPRAALVRTAAVQEVSAGGQQTLLNGSGYVTARREATVSSKVTGKVVEVLVEEGMKVEAGQVLAKLDAANVEASLELARAQEQSAIKGLEETKANLEQARRELRRIAELAVGKIASQSELDRADADVKVLAARLGRQQAEIALKIDEEFANSPFETKTEPEGAFAQGFAQQVADVGTILMAVLSAVFFTILLVAGNTMAQSVRERTEELGVLKAIGFTNTGVLALVLAESLVITAVGGFAGLSLAWLVAANGSPAPSILPVFYLPPRDLLIGAALAFAGLDVGKKIRVGQNEWDVVGIFTAGGGLPESEIWTDAAVLQPAYNRGDSYQSVYAKLNSAGAFAEFKDALTANPQLKVKVVRQSEYLAEQSTSVTGFVRSIGVFIAVLMALGALFGALNTMYSAVAARTREIATLRALGFGAGPVVFSVMIESLALALIGGSVGALGAYLAFNGFQASTMNWQSFSQVAFAFAVTPALLINAIMWSAIIGLLGGLFPALRAARLPIAAALRET